MFLIGWKDGFSAGRFGQKVGTVFGENWEHLGQVPGRFCNGKMKV